MKTIKFALGVAMGVMMASAAITAMYPDVSRRMTRDARRAVKCCKQSVGDMFRS